MHTITEYIKEKYTEHMIAEMLDDEILNWVDLDWDEDEDYSYDNEFDWYFDNNNSEAEDALTERLIEEACSDLDIDEPDTDTYISVFEEIKELFML